MVDCEQLSFVDLTEMFGIDASRYRAARPS
jgi:hypothetical protein